MTTGPNVITMISSTRGDLSSLLVVGSAPTLGLLPGANSVALLITGGTVTTVASWPECFQAADDLIYGAT